MLSKDAAPPGTLCVQENNIFWGNVGHFYKIARIARIGRSGRAKGKFEARLVPLTSKNIRSKDEGWYFCQYAPQDQNGTYEGECSSIVGLAGVYA